MRKLILASIILLFAMVCIGLVQFTSLNMNEQNELQEQISVLKDKHVALNVNILRTNLGLNQNYDPLVTLQKDIEVLQTAIGHSPLSEVFQAHLDLLSSVTKRKFHLLEQFKGDYAILKNAEASLPIISKELLDEPKLSPQIKEMINVFVKNTLQYRLLPNTTLENNLRNDIAKLYQEEPEVPKTQIDAYNLFLIHAKNLINKHKSLIGIFKDLYSSQVFYQIDEIQKLFDSHVQRKTIQGKILNYSLIILIIALLAVLVIIGRMMVKAQYSLTRSNAKLNHAFMELTKTQDKLEKSNYLLSKQNEGVMASIKYGKRIQEIHLPSHKELTDIFPEHFIYYSPKDVVSGDFYWLHEQDDKLYFVVADATGHGVPGAMLSVMGIRLLDGIVGQHGCIEPCKILTLLDKQMNMALKQRDTNNKDGMDIAMIVLDKKARTLQFAGAKNDIFYMQNGEAHRVRGNRFSIGGVYDKVKQFDTITIPAEKGSPITFYLYTDGFQDQFGGELWRKFGTKRFREYLQEIHQHPLPLQDDMIRQELAKWKGIGTQTDDILVAGIRLEL